ncbi:hypothetical protein DNTS_003635 [Danionella cerebrum]|uniref:Ubiquitin-like domain-containing protein n=1 Tax=Danionella cerebrum TaxID=2873325 RepID=A0A553NRJ4_9TELE|nr:hypothetical protein DNTS_003635 [Danionella translucida]
MMSRDTFAFSSASLRSLRLEQDLQDWEDARRALAHRRAMIRRPLPAAPRLRHGNEKIQTVRAPPPQIRCRDPAVHKTFMWGDIKGVYAVLKEPGMVNALMETVHEEMVWAPEMGMWTLVSKVKQTSALRLAASRGHAACVEELLFREAEVDADPGGRSALHDACSGGHHICVRLLLDHGADPDQLAEDGNAPLHLCSAPETFHCAELLVSSGALVNVAHRVSSLTPLHLACRRGLEEHVELYLSHGGDVMARSQEGETPLNAACAGAERPADTGRYLRIVQKLLAAGADAQTFGRKKHTALHNACGNCCPSIVIEDYPNQYPELVAQSLLNYGAQPASPRMLKLCLYSPATLEVMLNCYTVIPACEEWLEDAPEEILKEHQAWLYRVRQMSGQLRSLQHLCRCALRHHLGTRCNVAFAQLNIPGSLKDYLLLSLGAGMAVFALNMLDGLGLGHETVAVGCVFVMFLAVLFAWLSTHVADRGDHILGTILTVGAHASLIGLGAHDSYSSAQSSSEDSDQPDEESVEEDKQEEGDVRPESTEAVSGDEHLDIQGARKKLSSVHTFEEDERREEEEADDVSSITVRLKFLNDTEELAILRPQDTIGQLKSKYFSGREQRVKLIFQGQLLQDPQRSLLSLNIRHNSVLHCHISPAQRQHRPAPEEPPAHGLSLDTGRLLVPAFVLLLAGFIYYFPCHRLVFAAPTATFLVGSFFLVYFIFSSHIRRM